MYMYKGSEVPRLPTPEVGIYKRKQSKKTRKKSSTKKVIKKKRKYLTKISTKKKSKFKTFLFFFYKITPQLAFI